MTIAYIGLGSNLGERAQNISTALKLLNHPPAVQLLRLAPLYSTAPVGDTEQGWFLNTVAELKTTLAPLELLKTLLAVENQMGRVRTRRWGPRNIDLDLLLYGNITMDSPELTLPHPRITERAFVMVPLADLNPTLMMPGNGTAAQLAKQLRSEQQITPYPKGE